MTLEQLRIFVAVAERQHVTRAAQALNLAQSAASHAIAMLEARHDVRLFDRVGRRIELTEAGRALLPEARAILALTDQAEAVLGGFGRLERGSLAVHASQTIASYWLPRHLVDFRRAYPGIVIHLTVGNTAQVAGAVAAGVAELGFVEGMVTGDSLAVAPVARDRLVIIVGSRHPWAGIRDPDPSLLKEGDWVLREPGSGTRSVFEQAMAGFGIDPALLRIAMELPTNEAVRAAVEAGMGVTAISASVAASGIEAGLLHQVPLDLPDRAFHLLRHSQRQPGRIAEALLSLIRKGTSP